jgi:hypothetical protein
MIIMPRWSVDIIRKRAEHLGMVETRAVARRTLGVQCGSRGGHIPQY